MMVINSGNGQIHFKELKKQKIQPDGTLTDVQSKKQSETLFAAMG